MHRAVSSSNSINNNSSISRSGLRKSGAQYSDRQTGTITKVDELLFGPTVMTA